MKPTQLKDIHGNPIEAKSLIYSMEDMGGVKRSKM